MTAPTSFDLSSSSSVSSKTSDNTPTLSWDEVADTAYYQLFVDGSQQGGNITDTSYTLPDSDSLSEGDHSWYVKAYDSAGNETQSTSTFTFTIDRTNPLASYTNSSGDERSFSLWEPENNTRTDNRFPAFSFGKTKDDRVGIEKYQVIVDDTILIDNIEPDAPTDGTNQREDVHRKVFYDGDTIKAYSKEGDKALSDGARQWKVKAQDKAGNTLETETWTLRVNTSQAIVSSPSVFFPLSLLQLGEKKVNITTLDSTTIPSSLTISSSTPTFYGITTINTKVKLKIKSEKLKTEIEEQTTANPQSRFGINITSPLNPGEYTVSLSAQNPQGDYAEIPEFKLTIGREALGTPPTAAGVQTTTIEEPPKEEELPTSTPQPTPTLQPKAGHLLDETPLQPKSLWQRMRETLRSIWPF